MLRLSPRTIALATRDRLVRQGLHPLLAQVYAGRGIGDRAELDYPLAQLIDPAQMLGAGDAAGLLADLLQRRARMMVVADFDCDGATTCAVAVRALRAFGAEVDFLVPNRFEYGYGLTPEIVALAATNKPDLIITVDNGIASHDGVDAARALGIQTLITDHHLPAATLPAAACIVNPNQPGCPFPSKSIAGVGVVFYVMLALRSELRRRGWFSDQRVEPNLAHLLDLVALGTVADVVRLDRNNRILVSQGVARIQQMKTAPGIAALFRVAGRSLHRATTNDLAFQLAPRLNAAGRLSDMQRGIDCLLTEHGGEAWRMAQELDALNQERRSIEQEMAEGAARILDQLETRERHGVALFDPNWHQGVVGILAGRLRERLHRPVIAFARCGEDTLKGSGRSIPGLHLRDALDLVAKREPGLLRRFGGHAGAVGVLIGETDFGRFQSSFDAVVETLLAPEDLHNRVETDGTAEPQYLNLQVAQLLEREVWGQGFPRPLFVDEFQVEQQRLLQDKHLKLRLSRDGFRFDAIRFNDAMPLPATARLAYRLSVNEFNGTSSAQLVVEQRG